MINVSRRMDTATYTCIRALEHPKFFTILGTFTVTNTGQILMKFNTGD